MKASAMVYKRLLIGLTICLAGCKINTVSVPDEVVIKRADLPTYPFGNYIFGEDNERKHFSGELIGVRNDTLVVLSDTLHLVTKSAISYARVVLYQPNNYNAGYLLLIPNIIMMGAGISYEGAAILFGGLLSAVDIVAILSAKSWEKSNFNYVDWSENPDKLLQYSRFPAGIPSEIELFALRPKSNF